MMHLPLHLVMPTITLWKCVGYLGISMFSGRWLVQLIASRRAGKPVMPRLFWIMSCLGSLLCLAYFTFGKNDSVGILSYLMPSGIALYNLFLDRRHRKREQVEFEEKVAEAS